MSSTTPIPLTYATDASPAEQFSRKELRRTGVAALMLVVGGFVVIMGMTIAMGFYSSLAHSGPKAVVDGAVLTLLIYRGRWRCLSLVAIVYGLTLLLQLGNPYVFGVITIAGLTAAALGRLLSPLGFWLAIAVATVAYEILAGFGMPIRILLSTEGDEPILWVIWFAEWPLRAAGALIGVWLAARYLRNRGEDRGMAPAAAATSAPVAVLSAGSRTADARTKGKRTNGQWSAGLRIGMSIVACFLPMVLQSWTWLVVVACVYLIYAILAGLRWGAVNTLLGLLYGWIVFSGASYLWHHDWDRVVDLLRTFVIRFVPLMLSSAVLVMTVRPIDVMRLLRTLRCPGVIVLPLSHVFRGIPDSRREFGNSIASLRRDGVWRGPLSIFRRPRTIARSLLGPQFRRWADELAR
jgi:hypothetical protein